MNTGFQDGFNLAWKLALVLRGDAHPRLLESYHAERHYIGQKMLALCDQVHQNLFQHHPTLGTRVAKWVAAHLAHHGVMHPRKWTLDETRIGYHHSPIVREHQPKLGGSAWRSAPHAGDRAPDARLNSRTDGRANRLFELIREPRHFAILMEGERNRVARDDLQNFAAEIAARYRGLVEPLVILHTDAPDRDAVTSWYDAQGELHCRYGAEQACLYVIRPDGYVGYRSPTLDATSLNSYFDEIFLSKG